MAEWWACDVKLVVFFCASEEPVDSKGLRSNQKVNALAISLPVYFVYVSLANLVPSAFVFSTESTKKTLISSVYAVCMYVCNYVST